MQVSKYEQTFICVKTAINVTKNVDAVVAVLRNASAPMTCKEIGTALWGDAYKRFPAKEIGKWGENFDREKHEHNRKAVELTADLSHILGSLNRERLVKVTKEKGEPFTIETEECVNVYEGEICERNIEVWDAKGNKYEIANPNYHKGNYEMRKVPTTITPTIKKYSLV